MFTRLTLCVLLLPLAGVAGSRVSYSLTDAGGKPHTEVELQHHKATVLLFVATDCPNANTYAPLLGRLYREYSPHGVLFLGVYSDPAETPASVRQHDGEYQIPYPALLDPAQTLARQTGARTTPEAVILDSSGEELYRGRVDDRFVDFGKTRFKPAHEDLRDALDQILKGQPVANRVTKVLGCAIPGVN